MNVICRDGNILWNIAPDRNGKLSGEVHARIREFGAWIRENGEAIYGTRGGPLEPVDGVFGTVFNKNTVYLHILDGKRFSGMAVGPFPGLVLSVQRMDGQDIKYTVADGMLHADISDTTFSTDTILKLTLDREITPVVSDVYFTGK